MKNKDELENTIEIEETAEFVLLRPKSPLTLSNSKVYDNSFDYKKLLKGKEKLVIDFSELENYDSYLVIYLNEIKAFCKINSIEFQTKGMDNRLQRFIETLTPKTADITKGKQPSYWYKYFKNIGDLVKIIFSDLYKLVEFVGDLFKNFFRMLFKPSLMRWVDFPEYLISAGVNAVPITVLIVFLIGVISGYQGAVQLAQFGADKFLANLIGISITRELSPLMVAIIVAGRSGAAFAAEIGTMKVSEEIDALTTMGFDKMLFLVLPRVLAVAISMPILVLICDVAGIAGGMLAGLASLDITISSFLSQLNIALSYWDVFSGILKSVVFGLLISTIGCFRGFQVEGGAESVGRYTTASVVTGIFFVILVDALFVFVLSALGI